MVVGQICYNCDFMSVTETDLKECPLCGHELRTVFNESPCKYCGLAECDTVQVWEGMDDTDHYDIYSSRTVYGPGYCALLKESDRLGKCASCKAKARSSAWMELSKRVGKREDILDDIIRFKMTLEEMTYYEWDFDYLDLVKIGIDLGYFSYSWED